ncbi:MAG: ATP-binding cassette domain-containing protein [Bifidobacterium catenulatum]
MARRNVLYWITLYFLCSPEDSPARRPSAKQSPLLRRFGLEGLRNHRFSELSGGEAQRLMLARAVISHPSLMLVDEPTAQLDIRTAATVSDALARIAQFDTIVVVATHDSRTRDACTDIINLEFFQ